MPMHDSRRFNTSIKVPSMIARGSSIDTKVPSPSLDLDAGVGYPGIAIEDQAQALWS